MDVLCRTNIYVNPPVAPPLVGGYGYGFGVPFYGGWGCRHFHSLHQVRVLPSALEVDLKPLFSFCFLVLQLMSLEDSLAQEMKMIINARKFLINVLKGREL